MWKRIYNTHSTTSYSPVFYLLFACSDITHNGNDHFEKMKLDVIAIQDSDSEKSREETQKVTRKSYSLKVPPHLAYFRARTNRSLFCVTVQTWMSRPFQEEWQGKLLAGVSRSGDDENVSSVAEGRGQAPQVCPRSSGRWWLQAESIISVINREKENRRVKPNTLCVCVNSWALDIVLTGT